MYFLDYDYCGSLKTALRNCPKDEFYSLGGMPAVALWKRYEDDTGDKKWRCDLIPMSIDKTWLLGVVKEFHNMYPLKVNI